MKWNYICILIIINVHIYTIYASNKKFLTSIRLNNKLSSSKLLLPKLTIDNDHQLRDYFPLFLQTHILKTNSKHLNNLDYSTECNEKYCEFCDKLTRKTCIQCVKGFYMHMGMCYNTCPKNYIADIFKRECNRLNERNVLAKISYVKAFTTGSCHNRCGKVLGDCSCEYDCATKGICCSDYNHCEDLIMNNKGREAECKSKARRIGKCEFCDFVKDKCLQCEEGSYLREGKCVSMCNESDRVNSDNQICLLKHECSIDYCSQCLDNNNDRCKKCNNGFFLFNGQCLERCPYKYRADRISWQCLETPIFAWYWLFPTKSSCRARCDYKMNELEMDCSCEEECYRYGNCCQDFEDECPKFVFWK